MIVRRLQDLLGTEADVRGETWTSRRLLLAKDGMGFSLHDTVVDAGTTTTMCYRHHLEAVYCIEGEGELEATATGTVHPLGPGTMYALDQHDEHIVRATTKLRMVCVFNPPVTGAEVHDDTGAFPPPSETQRSGS